MGEGVHPTGLAFSTLYKLEKHTRTEGQRLALWLRRWKEPG